MFKAAGDFIGSIAPKGWLAIGAVVAVLAIVAVIIANANDILDETRETAREAGESGAVIAGQEQTLDQLEDANNAERDVESGGERSTAAYNECLRNNRRPETCERNRPIAQ